jgi:RNA polymerase sigma-70 factor, ECF subfamily
MDNQLNQQFEKAALSQIKRLYRLAYSRVGNLQDAEDIVQETYLRAIKGFNTFKPGADVSNWLTQILINSVRDHFRKTSRTVPTVEIEEAFEDAMEPAQAGPEEKLCEAEVNGALAGALQSMPEEMLFPLLLREMNDSTYDDIANILEIPKGTVMSRLFRARAFLRRQLLSQAHSETNGRPEKKKSSPDSRGLLK